MVGNRKGEGEVWLSGWRRDYRIGNKSGVRTNYRGRDWDAPKFIHDLPPVSTMDAVNEFNFVISLYRRDFPEGGTVCTRSRNPSLR